MIMRKQTIGQKIFAVLLLFSFFCCLLLPLVDGKADNTMDQNAIAARLSAAFRTLYLADGRILFAIMESNTNGSPMVNSIDCMDASGNQLWACKITSSVLFPFMSISQKEDGSFIFLGKTEQGRFYIAFISQEGDVQSEMSLPENVFTPALSSSGVYFVVPENDKDASTLYKMDWTGQTTVQSIPKMESLNITGVIAEDVNTCLSILNKNADAQLVTSIICLSESGDMIWKHELGDRINWVVRDATKNDKGGITFTAEYNASPGTGSATQLYLTCLDAEGATVWRKEAISYDPVSHQIAQTNGGNYSIWGHINLSLTENRSFLLTIDRDGNYVDSEIKAVWGDCQRYIDGEMYAVIYSDENMAPLYITSFDMLENMQMDGFTIV